MKKTSHDLTYDSIINTGKSKRNYRDSLYNYIMVYLPSEHIHVLQKFCDAALVEAYKNGQFSNKK